MKKVAPILILTTAFNSCVTEDMCNKKFPPSSRTETVYYDTVVITHSQRFDTLFQYSSDTIYVKDAKSKIEVKVVRLPGDSIFIESECPPDTLLIEKVRKETTIERIKNVVTENYDRLLWVLGLGAAFFVSISLFIKKLRRR
jgi:hypothetical protein